MQRRLFLRLLGLSPIFYHWRLRNLSAAEMPVVAVAEGKDYAGITRNVLAALGGMKRFVKQGDIVVVKPNIGWDRKPEQASTRRCETATSGSSRLSSGRPLAGRVRDCSVYRRSPTVPRDAGTRLKALGDPGGYPGVTAQSEILSR